MARQLSDRQRKFLDALFGDAKGSIKDAKIIAGYSPNTSNQEIIKAIKELPIKTAKTAKIDARKATITITVLLSYLSER